MVASAALLFDISDDAVIIPSAHNVVLEYELLSLPRCLAPCACKFDADQVMFSETHASSMQIRSCSVQQTPASSMQIRSDGAAVGYFQNKRKTWTNVCCSTN